MSKQLRFALTFLVPFLTASLAQASRVLADEGGEGAGLRHVGLTWEGVLSTIVYGAIGIVPLFLVSITDAIAAIVVDVIAAIWAIVLLIGSLISIVKAVQR